MPIESSFATIADLNASYPAGTDYRKDGDNHIRGIKTAIKNTFPAVNSPITATDEDINAIAGLASGGLTLFEGGLVPPGIICMWAGLNADIPAGWVLCDGTNGTPDLSDRFLMGTILDDKGGVGSSHTKNVVAAGSHNHGTTGLTVLTADQMPLHTHPFIVSTITQNTVQTDGSGTGAIVLSQVAGSTVKAGVTGAPSTTSGAQIGGAGDAASQGHSHSIPTQANHTHSVDLRGKYFKLAFIQKTA